MGEIRKGKVSSINYDKGTIRVLYDDTGNITKELPILTFNDESKMPDINSNVIVVHLSNGSEMGAVLGTYWNEDKKAKSAKGRYKKNLGKNSYFYYEEKSGELIIYAKSIRFTTANVNITVDEIVRRIENLEARL